MNRDYMAFLYACTVIGGVAESNGRFQECLYRVVERYWETMTVSELLQQIESTKDEFNRIERIARGES